MARLAYFRALYVGFLPWTHTDPDTDTPWRALIAQTDAAPPAEIVIWAGANLSESIFLAMACHWLGARPQTLSLARPAPPEDPCYTADHPRPALATLYHLRRRILPAERLALATVYARLRDTTATLRQYRDGAVHGVAPNCLDPLVLAACPPDWTPAAQVVGHAMTQCDRRNRMSDLFFHSRLQMLITAGKIAARGPRESMRGYEVMRVGGGS